ncbi:hypothetical protein BC829DRAFT_254903 [Chytridium lagenaria]|nr:hypothetical protein BC829DRAFT_254903 [Chytridium lagenaria]
MDVLSSIYSSDCDENSAHAVRDRRSISTRAKSKLQADIDVSRFINRMYLSRLAYQTPITGGNRTILDRYRVTEPVRDMQQPIFMVFSDGMLAVNGEEAGRKIGDEVEKKQAFSKVVAKDHQPDNVFKGMEKDDGAFEPPHGDGSKEKVQNGRSIPNMPDTLVKRARVMSPEQGNAPVKMQRRSETPPLTQTPPSQSHLYIAMDHWNELIQSLTGVDISDIDISVAGNTQRSLWIRSRITGGEACLVYHKHGKKMDAKKIERIRKDMALNKEDYAGGDGKAERMAQRNTNRDVKGGNWKGVLRRTVIVTCYLVLAVSITLLLQLPRRAVDIISRVRLFLL